LPTQRLHHNPLGEVTHHSIAVFITTSFANFGEYLL
jgi:hypothetical protein